MSDKKMGKNTLDLPRYILYDDQENMIICAGESILVIADAIRDHVATKDIPKHEKELDQLIALNAKLDKLDIWKEEFLKESDSEQQESQKKDQI